MVELNSLFDRAINAPQEAFDKSVENISSARKIALIGKVEEELSSSGQAAKANRLGNSSGIVEFEVQPTVSETASASYAPVDDIRQAASMLIYMGSPSREFSITAKLVSRTKREAELAWKKVQILRSWRMPEASGNNSFNAKSPSRLTLSGLSGWYNQIAVRMTNLTIENPEDVDYIKSYSGYDVPIVWPITISLKEARSPNELKRFDIISFRQGRLEKW